MLNGGKWMSSLDLYRSHPVLIIGPRGHHWLDAGGQIAAEFHLDIHHIGADADSWAKVVSPSPRHQRDGRNPDPARWICGMASAVTRSVTHRGTRRRAGPCGRVPDTI